MHKPLLNDVCSETRACTACAFKCTFVCLPLWELCSLKMRAIRQGKQSETTTTESPDIILYSSVHCELYVNTIKACMYYYTSHKWTTAVIHIQYRNMQHYLLSFLTTKITFGHETSSNYTCTAKHVVSVLHVSNANGLCDRHVITTQSWHILFIPAGVGYAACLAKPH